MKKIVIFGGGTGLSAILGGLKQFPVDVTAVIAVSDNGSSTGVLKEELNIPAVGDLGKVLLSMSNVDEELVNLLSYRFQKDGTLYNHPVRNILLAALIDLKGDLSEATRYMADLLNIRGTVLPLTEEKVELIGHGSDCLYYGEEEVGKNIRDIEYVTYDHDIRVTPEILGCIDEADLVILSPGSLYTSLIPHLIADEVRDALDQTDAPILYISNIVTQPGETDGYTVGDHIREINSYLGSHKVDVVLANNGEICQAVLDVYREKENKEVVILDTDSDDLSGVDIISDSVITYENGSIIHDTLKTAYLVYSYLIKDE